MRESLRAIADGEPRLLSLPRPATPARRVPGCGFCRWPARAEAPWKSTSSRCCPRRGWFCSATPAVEALARIGAAMGYRVERSPDAPAKGAHVLIATMGDEDLELLQKVPRGGPGLRRRFASRKRFEHVRETLAACGVPRAALERVSPRPGSTWARARRRRSRSASWRRSSSSAAHRPEGRTRPRPPEQAREPIIVLRHDR